MSPPERYELAVTVDLPINGAPDARLHLITRADGGDPQVVLEKGSPAEADAALVRIHSACLTGDILGSMRCDCGQQFVAARDQICASEWGLLVYVYDHEGRGIGLADKLRAYLLQQAGYDTFEANVELGFPEDARNYRGAVEALRLLRVEAVDLLSSNPAKAAALNAGGIAVRSMRHLDVAVNPTNERYLNDKYARFAVERLLLFAMDP